MPHEAQTLFKIEKSRVSKPKTAMTIFPKSIPVSTAQSAGIHWHKLLFDEDHSASLLQIWATGLAAQKHEEQKDEQIGTPLHPALDRPSARMRPETV